MNFSSVLLRFCFNLAVYYCCMLSSAREHHANALPVRGNKTLGTFAAEKIIEKIQSRMRYGFPLLKIDPLSPMKLYNRTCALNLSFLQLNSSFENLLLEGIDRFTINRVKFNWANKSMDFSLTFHNLSLRGNFDGAGKIIKYIPIAGKGNLALSIYNMTTDVFSAIGVKSSRLQLKNITMISTLDRVKSNVKGVSSDNFLTARVVGRMLNRLIEVMIYNIFKLNQRLIDRALNSIVVPQINRILMMFVVLRPSAKFGNDADKSQTVYLHEQYDGDGDDDDDERIEAYLMELDGDDRRKGKNRAENSHYIRRVLCE